MRSQYRADSSLVAWPFSSMISDDALPIAPSAIAFERAVVDTPNALNYIQRL